MGCSNAKEKDTNEPENVEKGAIVVFVYGGPGSGKGTQCKKMADNYGFGHISTGALLRQEIEKGEENGKEIERVQKEGGMVDSTLVVQLLQQHLSQQTGVWLVDGFPRNQDNITCWQHSQFTNYNCLLYFECSESVMEERMLERSKTSGRADDNPTTIRNRLLTFQQETSSVLQHFQANPQKFVRISADGHPEDIFAEVRFQIEKRKLDYIQEQILQKRQTQVEDNRQSENVPDEQ